MSLSLSHGKPLDVGQHGIAQEDLPPMDAGRVDPRAWFRDPDAPASVSQRPIELEIGSGKGTFLVQHARLHPDVDYLGLEWAKAFWRYAADRARRHGLANVRLLRCDADMYVRHYVPDQTFRQIHVYFPDPWPKKRHHKRRLIQAGFLRELHRVLVAADTKQVPDPCTDPSAPGSAGGSVQTRDNNPPAEPGAGGKIKMSGTSGTSGGACVRIATDHADYFDWMLEHAGQVSDLFTREPFASPVSAGEGELVGTNFERKYRLEGRTFQGMILRKRP